MTFYKIAGGASTCPAGFDCRLPTAVLLVYMAYYSHVARGEEGGRANLFLNKRPEKNFTPHPSTPNEIGPAVFNVAAAVLAARF